MKHKFILITIFSMIALWFLFYQPMGIMTGYEVKFWQDSERIANEINARYDLPNQTSILYMDPGVAPYFFHANSSCRYISPLPIQRDYPDWNQSGQQAYKDEYACIMEYTGKYIVMDDGEMDWFDEDYAHRVPIMDKIHSEYNLVNKEGWRIWERKD